MASFVSLGTHTLCGLDYLVAESILPPNPSRDSYKWNVYPGSSDEQGEQELVYTEKCVVWSRGSVIFRAFRFDQEDEPVQQALLTWFPPDGQDPVTQNALFSGPASHLRRALVVIVPHQAHIYFQSGPSHSVRLQFEVDRAFAAPRGLILQRKIHSKNVVLPTPQPPPVPLNSFFSSQNTQRAAPKPSSRRQRGSTKRSHAPTSLEDFVIQPEDSASDTLSRHFILTDPFSEVGLVAEAPELDRSFMEPPSTLTSFSRQLAAMSEDEDIVYVSSQDELANCPMQHERPLMLLVTYNHVKPQFTVWNAAYFEPAPPSSQQDQASRPRKSTYKSKRHSSFASRMSTGANTPTLRGQDDAKAIDPAGRRTHPSFEARQSRLSESQRLLEEDTFDLNSKQDPEFALVGTSSQGNRRTSSRLARAELSSQDQYTFTDLARNPQTINPSFGSYGRKGQSFGSVNDRNSLGQVRLSGRPSSPGSVSLLSDVNESMSQDLPFENVWDSIIRSGGNAQRYPLSLGNVSGLAKELVVYKATCFVLRCAGIPDETESFGLANDIKFVTTTTSDPSIYRSFENLSLTVTCKSSHATWDVNLRVYLQRASPSASTSAKRTIPKCPLRPFPSRRRLVYPLDEIGDVTKVDQNGTFITVGFERSDRTKILICNPSNRHKDFPSLATLWPKYVQYTLVRIGSSPTIHSSIMLKGLDSLSQTDSPRTSDLHSFDFSPDSRFCHAASSAFDLESAAGPTYRIQPQLLPRSSYTRKVLHLCQLLLPPAFTQGNNFLCIWWEIFQLQSTTYDHESEWRAVIVSLFCCILQRFEEAYKPSPTLSQISADIIKRSKSRNGRRGPALHGRNCSAWDWVDKGYDADKSSAAESNVESIFILHLVKDAREILRTKQATLFDPHYLTRSDEPLMRWDKVAIARQLVLALHLLNEESKLNILSQEHHCHHYPSIESVIAQIGHWIGCSDLSWETYLAHKSPKVALDQCFEDREYYQNDPILNYY